jgi:hypothetical protein
MYFILIKKNIFNVIPLYTVSTQGIRVSFTDQLSDSRAFGRVLGMLSSEFPTLPAGLRSLIHKKAQFKVALNRYVITHSFHSVDEFPVLTSSSLCS